MTETFVADNRAYEEWLRTQCAVVESDLDYKHQRMGKSPFVFLRATFFRWAKVIEELCPDLKDAPSVLSVGDIHTENFGTWRDQEGRLVWGVNDFDEAAPAAYPFDILRLATSARLAPHTRLSDVDLSAAILNGYQKGLENPAPTFVYENGTWIMPYVQPSASGSLSFWRGLSELPEATVPAELSSALVQSLPLGTTDVSFRARTRRGGGGLGRPRYVAVGRWQGGTVVREAKAWVPSAWDWARGATTDLTSDYMKLATGPHRSRDPYLERPDGPRFILRRLAPDSRKINLDDGAGLALDTSLLSAMGADLASIHAGDPQARASIVRDLARRSNTWLTEGITKAVSAVQADFSEWVSSKATATDAPATQSH